MSETEQREKLKVIYCMGSGRSGSTLMSIILGNHPKISGPGEIYTIHRLKEENFSCSCGERVEECTYWASILEEWKSNVGIDSFNQYVFQSKNVVENFKSPIAWLNLILNYPSKRALYKNYQDNTYHYLSSIINHSKKPILIDISKNPLRAFALLKHPNIDLKLIHLVRDGRSLAFSLKNSRRENIRKRKVSRTALFWLIANRQSDFVLKRAKNGLRIKYEDLALHTDRTLERIAKVAEVDPKHLLDVIKGSLANDKSHIMEGNRLRNQKSIKIKLNTDWEEQLDFEKQRTFYRIAGKTLRRYGYQPLPKNKGVS
ncbi:sulfotransferase [Eudoraea chungangensis]|uniref:sulfotransferase n=1 Tax=Eudoraea chungangensis TaxID=1481905 RepID=UPI0023ECB6B8|nr:sulfotransferase [Eudoraea chungangensis]